MNKLFGVLLSVLCCGIIGATVVGCGGNDNNVNDNNVKDNVIENTHVHNYGDWAVTTPATCTQDGLRERVCSCGENETETIKATGHSYATEWTSDETYHWHAATCEHTSEVTDKAEHSYGNWTVTKQATCTETGSREKVCACGYKVTEEISATGHSYATEWTSDETYHWHAATCEHTSEVTDKAEHSYGNWTVTKQATCTETGSREKVCACGYKVTEEISATGHSYATEWTSDETYHWHAATCEHASEVTDKAEHTYENGKCICGYSKRIVLSSDTDYDSLVSERVTEDEWKAAFEKNNYTNYTERISHDGVMTYFNSTVTNGEKLTCVYDSAYMYCKKTTDSKIYWYYGDNDWEELTGKKYTVYDNWFLIYTFACPDFGAYFEMFRYDEQLGAYVFGDIEKNSGKIETNAIMSYTTSGYYYAVVKIINGRLAYVTAYDDSIYSGSEICFYDFGTTEIIESNATSSNDSSSSDIQTDTSNYKVVNFKYPTPDFVISPACIAVTHSGLLNQENQARFVIKHY